MPRSRASLVVVALLLVLASPTEEEDGDRSVEAERRRWAVYKADPTGGCKGFALGARG
jgi:hypothetical protein